MADLLLFPTEAKTTPPDAAARAEALDIRSSFVVEAPAGSGKTGLLIQRYLKLLADESVTAPEQVLAITFTNKATAELRERVIAQLELAQSDSMPPATGSYESTTHQLARAVLERDRQLGWSLLDHPHRLHLRTIDSVCAEIARSLPILSGGGGRLMPAEDAAPLHHEAARRTLLQLGSGDDVFDEAVRTLLLNRDGNLKECESLIADMLNVRDQWARLIPFDQHELGDAWLDANILPSLEQALGRAICRGLPHVARIFPPDLLDELTGLASDMAHSQGYEGELSPVAVCRDKRQAPAALAEHLEHWRAFVHLLVKPSKPIDWRRSLSKNVLGFEIEPHHSARLKQLIGRISATPELFHALCAVNQLPPAEYPREQWVAAKSLFRVLSRALVELQLVFAERGECDFTELSLLARHALAQDSGTEDLAAALGARLQHLLVDEMQDTSTSQYDLIERLTATWDGHSQTVFLVGDPHQSIYLFRQARVERFIQTMMTERLGDISLKCLHLTANFRSQQTLVDKFNDDFKRIFSGSEEAAPYREVEATLARSRSSRGVVWHVRTVDTAGASAGGSLTAPELRQQQSRENAAEILRIAREWRAKPLPPGRTKPWSLAVLVRSRNHLNDLVAALRRERDPIPFRAVDIELLSERQEILDLTALTRALLHPADRVAGLAVLRAPWCGLPLADLYTLAGGDDPAFRHYSIARLMVERGHLLPDESCRRMTRVWAVLQSAGVVRGSLTTAQLVERAWLSLGGDAWLTPNQLANSRRFFQLLDEIEDSGGRLDAALLDAQLRHLFAEPEPIPSKSVFIELLTIHKSKGLEWDVVLVPALEKQVVANRSRLLTWSEIDPGGLTDENAAHIMLAPIPGKGEPSQALNIWLNSLHRTREFAETKRLFYVASTRAREELHLFAAPDESAKGTVNPAATSLLRAAWPAAESYFADVATASAPFAAKSAQSEPASLEIAAAASAGSVLVVPRVPATFDPDSRFAEALGSRISNPGTPDTETPAGARITRPGGSVAARSYGNAVHACLDLLSNRIEEGDTTDTLLAELSGWTRRITALLRSDGLSRAIVERLARDVRTALENALRDPTGRWLLAAHRGSASELSITSSVTDYAQDASGALPVTVRVDRVFEAGAEPCEPGDDILWIVDYKTAAPSTGSLESFLNVQRAIYSPQLEAYARVLAQARAKSIEQVRLALYFPAIPHLLWWQPAGL